MRGISWFAPVLLRLVDLDAAHDAQLMRQKVAALLTGFIRRPNGAAGFEGRPEDDDALESGLEPGTLKVFVPARTFVFPTRRASGARLSSSSRSPRPKSRPAWACRSSS